MNDIESNKIYKEILRDLDQLINLGDDIINFDLNFN